MLQLLGDSAGPQPDNALLQELFFQWLLSHVRMVLASSGDTVSLNTLTNMADKMLEVAPPTVSSLTSPAAPPTPQPPPPASLEVAQLRSKISKLRQLISLQLCTGRPNRSHSRSYSHSRASSPGPFSGLCWYQRRFGVKANKCTSPCSWHGNGQS